MKYMGCVTDISWKLAVMEIYPNRSFGHGDALKRSRLAAEKRDIPELAIKSNFYERRRVYDVPKADLTSPRWTAARKENLTRKHKVLFFMSASYLHWLRNRNKKKLGLQELLRDIERAKNAARN